MLSTRAPLVDCHTQVHLWELARVLYIQHMRSVLCTVPESTGPGVRVGRVRSSGGRGFSERVAAPTRLSCPGFSCGEGLTRGATASRVEGQGGYECRVEIYFTAMFFDN